MLESPQLLALVAFVALAIAIFLVIRRTGRLVALTRERQAFVRAVTDLDARVGDSLDGVAGRIDALRRGTLSADAIADSIAIATRQVERYAAEARELRATGAADEIRSAIIADLERAARALQTVEHGRAVLAAARASTRELEAHTSIKRGYLNILHAREAMTRHVQRAVELADASSPGLFQRRNA